MKKIVFFLISCMMVAALCGCAPNVEDAFTEDSRFQMVEYNVATYVYGEDTELSIIYDTETGVEYVMVDTYQGFAISPLYDANGEVSIRDMSSEKAGE